LQSNYAALEDFPEIGPRRLSIGHGVRAIFFRDYVSYYHVGDAEVIVLRILHGRRDHAAMAAEGKLLKDKP
jgi:toxin ParE1/3/4